MQPHRVDYPGVSVFPGEPHWSHCDPRSRFTEIDPEEALVKAHQEVRGALINGSNESAEWEGSKMSLRVEFIGTYDLAKHERPCTQVSSLVGGMT